MLKQTTLILNSHYLILLTKKLKKHIRECEEEIETIKTLPYYTIFKRYAEQERDLQELQKKLERLQLQSQFTDE